MFVQLIYISVPTTPPVIEAVKDFIPIAQMKNAEHKITGIIISSDQFYLQLIEGNRDKVNQLYNNILKDPRHHDMVLLRYNEVRNREFDNWSMAHVPLSSLNDMSLNGSSLPDYVTPETLSGPQALALLRRVYATMKVEQKLDSQ